VVGLSKGEPTSGNVGIRIPTPINDDEKNHELDPKTE
jgi:hypothetical protein